MIENRSIEQLKDSINLNDLMSEFATKQKSLYCCPIHDEQTASLSIKNNSFYKCFGCGASGNAITLVMQVKKLSFYDAVLFLADKYKFTLQYEEGYDAQKVKASKSEKAELLEVVQMMQKLYVSNINKLPSTHEAIVYLNERGIGKEEIAYWGLGYAPPFNKQVSQMMAEYGKLSLCQTIGYSNNKNGTNWDFLNNRITIPIHDAANMLVGIGGRSLEKPDENGKVRYKYLNPKDSILYKKSNILYGLNKALPAIKEKGYVFLTEGNFDVQTMHNFDIDNTVGSCGTAINADTLKLLKRYCSSIVIATDNDTAGKDAALKIIDEAFRQNMKCQVLAIPYPYKDLDIFIRSKAEQKQAS
jgi:DNA primase